MAVARSPVVTTAPMALINCPSCATEVSDQAAACPRCGHPIKPAPPPPPPPKKPAGCLTQIAVLSLAGFLLMFFFHDPGASKSSSRPQLSDAQCRDNLQCWGERHIGAAAIACKPRISALANYAHEWTYGFLGNPFSRWNWRNKEAGHLMYMGNEVTFQNAFGASRVMNYRCDFDPASGRVIDVIADPR